MTFGDSDLIKRLVTLGDLGLEGRMTLKIWGLSDREEIRQTLVIKRQTDRPEKNRHW